MSVLCNNVADARLAAEPRVLREDLPCGAGCRSVALDESDRQYLQGLSAAGRAVFLLYFGHKFGSCGMAPYADSTSFDCHELKNEHEMALSFLEGPVAEWEWVFPGSQLGATDLDSAHHATHHLINAAWAGRSDALQVIRLAEKLQPRDSDALVTCWICEARDLLRERGVWNSAVALADLLRSRSSLDSLDAVREVARVLSLGHQTNYSVAQNRSAMGEVCKSFGSESRAPWSSRGAGALGGTSYEPPPRPASLTAHGRFPHLKVLGARIFRLRSFRMFRRLNLRHSVSPRS